MYEVIKLQIKIRGQYALLHTPFRGSFINPKPVTIHKHSNYHDILPDIHPPLRLHLESPAGVSGAPAPMAWLSVHNLLPYHNRCIPPGPLWL